MKNATTALAVLLALSACSEPPKHQIVFTHEDTCRIQINDLQYGQANDTDRPCQRITEDGDTVAVTVNFLSETCNAYRYDRVGAREGSEGVFVFKPENNEPNPNCRFIPQYADPAAQWVLLTQPPPED